LVFVAVMALVACAITPLYRLNQRLKAEYGAGRVILDVADFVEAHDGRWPGSWDDLPYGAHARDYVRMDFDVDVEELIRDPKLLHSSIVPVTGEYKTYPHADWHFEKLREVLMRHHGKSKSPR
jgi:hypothetical protein